MKIRIVTIGEPKLSYAKSGWEEYFRRLGKYHKLEVIHLKDKYSDDYKKIFQKIEGTFKVALDRKGKQMSSRELAKLLENKSREAVELSFIIGGPKGLPKQIINSSDLVWSLSELTFPHDLSMVILLEALYRASSINASEPYHK